VKRFFLASNHQIMTVQRTMDKIDHRLLALLQEDSSLSHVEISERVHLSPSQCSRRLQRLQQEGYIGKQVTLLNEEKLGLQVEGYVMVTLTSRPRSCIDHGMLLIDGRRRLSPARCHREPRRLFGAHQ
jgi:DNA-binding Lrp family transcriptional regulator